MDGDEGSGEGARSLGHAGTAFEARHGCLNSEREEEEEEMEQAADQAHCRQVQEVREREAFRPPFAHRPSPAGRAPAVGHKVVDRAALAPLRELAALPSGSDLHWAFEWPREAICARMEVWRHMSTALTTQWARWGAARRNWRSVHAQLELSPVLDIQTAPKPESAAVSGRTLTRSPSSSSTLCWFGHEMPVHCLTIGVASKRWASSWSADPTRRSFCPEDPARESFGAEEPVRRRLGFEPEHEGSIDGGCNAGSSGHVEMAASLMGDAPSGGWDRSSAGIDTSAPTLRVPPPPPPLMMDMSATFATFPHAVLVSCGYMTHGHEAR